MELVEFCELKSIILFSLPPRSSHFLQPLNVMLFQLFKHYHRQTIEMAMRTGCTNFNIIESSTLSIEFVWLHSSNHPSLIRMGEGWPYSIQS
jgi:hypothetical protein